ncbi:TPA: hypothetical protein ACKRHV_003718 [Proteus mirabilis]|uniref:Prophage protein n=2 Tax=Proteus TaxID=583 RepID=A0AAN3YWZ8_PROMI|nr:MULTISPECIES: hypothetical protein [Proteus]ASB03443.1 hypothetical protein AM403_17895 [Proteus mirabilis]EKW9778261.1 hypothetical protein [Proteus mirabilis]ELA7212597.1 hypothetical protein [Proteus mirabilis]ELA7951451.1 hypothetical protein [Proteus mirabilis]ELI0198439.1 hypothetical protein [Proteus mirabilis]
MKFLTITALLVGIAGACLLSFGAWLTYPPMGYMCAGGLCLFWSYLVSKALGQSRNSKEE